jgi:hypothetical protein
MSHRVLYGEDDPRRHTAKMKAMLSGVADYAWHDVGRVSDPRARALLKTTAEILLGLRKAYDEFEQEGEMIWRKAS